METDVRFDRSECAIRPSADVFSIMLGVLTMDSWDIFIAHSGADGREAEILYGLLNDQCRVFLDSRCLRLGDDWDRELARAQRASRVTVVLISATTEHSYYQREEIAAAIEMARQDAHRVVPMFLHPVSAKSDPVPVRPAFLKHGLEVKGEQGIKKSAPRLHKLISELNDQSKAEVNGEQRDGTDESVVGLLTRSDETQR